MGHKVAAANVVPGERVTFHTSAFTTLTTWMPRCGTCGEPVHLVRHDPTGPYARHRETWRHGMDPRVYALDVA